MNVVDKRLYQKLKGEFVRRISIRDQMSSNQRFTKTCELVEEAERCREAQVMKLSGTLIHTGVAQP